ncbi:ABC transporter ATP-binding protein [Hyphococcus sp.]|uniref:ABC transporter ATP-binding protein n=1 Tax=Hyphococcus sp. TaxID=2038636 RepID=UPI003D103EA3
MSALLSVENVSCRMGEKSLLENASLAVGAGDFVGLIGPNGAGKSTLLRIAANLQKPSTGRVLLGGTLTNSLSPAERARRLSYLPQAREIAWTLTAREIVALGRFAWGAPLRENAEDAAAVARAMDETGADAFADRLAHTLSGGELARVHLARLLASETPIIIADEPVSALDPAHQFSVMKLLRAKAEEGRTVIAALHELPLAARFCTRIVALHKGEVAADGKPADVLHDDLMREIFGVRAGIQNTGGEMRVHLDPLTD